MLNLGHMTVSILHLPTLAPGVFEPGRHGKPGHCQPMLRARPQVVANGLVTPHATQPSAAEVADLVPVLQAHL